MTGELLRQSHVASGFDAGKSVMAAENERLKAELARVRDAAQGVLNCMDPNDGTDKVWDHDNSTGGCLADLRRVLEGDA